MLSCINENVYVYDMEGGYESKRENIQVFLPHLNFKGILCDLFHLFDLSELIKTIL